MVRVYPSTPVLLDKDWRAQVAERLVRMRIAIFRSSI